MSLVFFIAKFFEARADLESAIVTGKPQMLASALRKIGAHRLEMPSFGVGEWLNWEPHPPIRFRIARLERLKTTEIKHTLIQSVKDVIEGFLGSFRRNLSP
jgi:heat shock protein HtpX